MFFPILVTLLSMGIPLAQLCLQTLDYDKQINGPDSFVIIGFAPLRSQNSSSINTMGLVAAESIKYAVNEANNKVLLNNTQLSYIVFDDCGESKSELMVRILIEITYNLFTKKNIIYADLPLGTVGPYNSAGSKLWSEVTSFLHAPVISYLSTSVELNNRKKYSNFYRTIPSDESFSTMVVDLIKHFNWTYVSILASDNSYGWHGRYVLRSLFKEQNICTDIDALFAVPFKKEEIKRALINLKGTYKTNVVILYATSEATDFVLRLASDMKMYGITWILTDASRLSESIRGLDPKVIVGALSAYFYASPYTAFSEHFWNKDKAGKSKWIEQYMKENPGQPWEYNPNFESAIQVSGFVRKAVYSFAHALKKYNKYIITTKDPLVIHHKPRKHRQHNSTLLNEFVRKTDFQLEQEQVQFNKYGSLRDKEFLILNVDQTMSVRTVGNWSNHGGLMIAHDNLTWATGEVMPTAFCSQECSPGMYPVYDIGTKCCWICVKCSEGTQKPYAGNDQCQPCPEGISDKKRVRCLWYSWIHMYDEPSVKYFQLPVAVISACLVLLIAGIWIKMRDHPVVKATNFQLSIIQLFFHFTLPVSVAAIQTQDNDTYSCVYRPMITTSQYIVIISLLSIRAELLVKAFNGNIRLTKLDVFIVKSVSYGLVVGSAVLNCALVIAVASYTGFGTTLVKSKRYLSKEIICDDFAVFSLQAMLVFIGFIICGSLAFRARNLPTKFNESRCIILCVLLSLMFMCILMMIDMSTERQAFSVIYTGLFFCLSNLTILLLIFGQKTFNILFDRSLNDKKIFQQNVFEDVVRNVGKKISVVTIVSHELDIFKTPFPVDRIQPHGESDT